MLTIRLTRKGKKNQPFFRVVLVDKRKSAKSGSAIEILGNVDPLTKKRNFKKDRILYWLSKGAKASPTVHNLFVSEKIVDAKKIHVSKLSKKKQADLAAQAGIAKEKSAKSNGVSDTPPAETPAETPAEEKPAESPKEEPKSEEQKPAEEKPA